MRTGGKNLVILGIVAVAIAIVSTSVSLFVYHDSGDIYLDLSRPELMKDKENTQTDENQNDEEKYAFPNGESMLTVEEFEEYLIHLDEEAGKLNAVPDPYSLESISDENLLNISE